MATMALRELTAETSEDGVTIRRVVARISDHPDRAEQTEWIEFQIAVDVPTVRNGALLRMQALEQASATLTALAAGFERLGNSR
jgi:hypothetical protein